VPAAAVDVDGQASIRVGRVVVDDADVDVVRQPLAQHPTPVVGPVVKVRVPRAIELTIEHANGIGVAIRADLRRRGG
jgi:hypothetical protein